MSPPCKREATLPSAIRSAAQFENLTGVVSREESISGTGRGQGGKYGGTAPLATTTTTIFSKMELPDLAFAVHQEHGRALRSARTTVDHAIRCGEILAAAKSKVPHGGWESWVEESTELSPRTAARYMQLAANPPLVTDLKGDLGIVEALEMIAKPAATTDSKPAEPSVVSKSKPTAKTSTPPLTIDAEIVEPSTAAETEAETDPAEDPIIDAVQRLVYILIHYGCSAEYINGLADAVMLLEKERSVPNE